MAPTPPRDESHDLRGTIGALIFIAVGAIAWWDTLGVSSPQATIFPRTIIALMVGFSVLLLIRNLVGHSVPEQVPQRGSVARRVLLLVAMAGAALLMPYIGFVAASLCAYVVIMAVAMYERWSPLRLVVYPAAGVVVVLAFYYLFDVVFQVPLPAGSLFE